MPLLVTQCEKKIVNKQDIFPILTPASGAEKIASALFVLSLLCRLRRERHSGGSVRQAFIAVSLMMRHALMACFVDESRDLHRNRKLSELVNVCCMTALQLEQGLKLEQDSRKK